MLVAGEAAGKGLPEAELPDGVERERIVMLRLRALERAGYDRETAEAIAGRLEIALPDALALRKSGYPPDVAFAMLTDGSRPVF